MKKKLIHTEQPVFLKCDNNVCDYHILNDDTKRKYKPYINQLCPNCGENLLTKDDYKRFRNMMIRVNIINFLFGWLGSYPDVESEKQKTFIVETYKKITIKDK